ncbi:MAG: twin-arginine translocation signal domain-containing protein, partial [Acidiferrobacterales bacterium]
MGKKTKTSSATRSTRNGKLSRRNFLKGLGAGTATAAL